MKKKNLMDIICGYSADLQPMETNGSYISHAN